MTVAVLKDYARSRFGSFVGDKKDQIIDNILKAQEENMDQLTEPGTGPGETLQAIKSNSRFAEAINPRSYIQAAVRLPPPNFVSTRDETSKRTVPIVITSQNAEKVDIPEISTIYQEKKVSKPSVSVAPEKSKPKPSSQKSKVDIDVGKLEESRSRGKGYRLDELKALASQAGIKTSGRKDELIDRLLDYVKNNS